MIIACHEDWAGRVITLKAPDQVHDPRAGLTHSSKRSALSAQWKGATQSGCSCQMALVPCCAHCSGSPLAFTSRYLLLMVSICGQAAALTHQAVGRTGARCGRALAKASSFGHFPVSKLPSKA